MDKWKRTTDNQPDLSNTQIGSLLKQFQALQSHYENELQKEKDKLHYLEQTLEKAKAQRNSRREDTNG